MMVMVMMMMMMMMSVNRKEDAEAGMWVLYDSCE